MDKEITKTRVADLTMDELRAFIRLEIARSIVASKPINFPDMSQFPVDDLGEMFNDSDIRREDMYSSPPFKKFDISKFPVVDVGETLDNSDIRREDMY